MCQVVGQPIVYLGHRRPGHRRHWQTLHLELPGEDLSKLVHCLKKRRNNPAFNPGTQRFTDHRNLHPRAGIQGLLIGRSSNH